MKGGLPVDWRAIKTEYITGNISMRELAEKHNIPFRTLRNRAQEEQWGANKSKTRARQEQRTLEKVVEQESTKLAKTDEKYFRILDKLFDKAEELVVNTEILTPTMLKDMATTMKYLKECKSIKSDADIREQEARIKKLEQELNADNKDTTITVHIDGEADRWNK
jgi:flagellar motility protein MotE (MotC chaperone)